MDRRDVLTGALTLVVAEGAGAQGLSTADVPAGAAGSATALERAAKVTIVHSAFAPGDVRRYGASGDGANDDSAAWRAALATGHRVLGGGSEFVYSLAQQLPITRSTVIDLQGATLKPHGETFAFVRTPPQPNASAGVTGGATQGSRLLTLRSAAGFRVGQWARLILNDYPVHDAASYPPSWSHIVAVHGDTVELDTPLQIIYGPAEPQLAAYDPGLLYERFECRNGIFDGSESIEDRATGQALRIGGTERVVVQACEFRDFRHGGQLTCAVELFTNVDVLVSDCRFTGGVSRFNMCDIQEARFAHFLNNQMDGSHFGCNITRVDAGLFANNSFQGRRAAEAAAGVTPPRSARGMKAYGCATIRVLGNHAADYESPIKVEACFRYDVSHNTLFNAGLSPYSGQIALNVGSIARGSNMHDGRIIGNHVESSGGIAIGVTSDAPGGVCICENIVRACQAIGIHVGVLNVIVSGNRVEDWGLRGAGDAAIHVEGHASIVDNRFAHATLTSLPCLSASGGGLVTRDNVSESGNRLT
jgi:hypothetical protein